MLSNIYLKCFVPRPASAQAQLTIIFRFLQSVRRRNSSPRDAALEVDTIMKGVNEAVGRTQRGQGVLSHLCTIHQLQHSPRIRAHIVLKRAVQHTHTRTHTE